MREKWVTVSGLVAVLAAVAWLVPAAAAAQSTEAGWAAPRLAPPTATPTCRGSGPTTTPRRWSVRRCGRARRL